MYVLLKYHKRCLFVALNTFSCVFRRSLLISFFHIFPCSWSLLTWNYLPEIPRFSCIFPSHPFCYQPGALGKAISRTNQSEPKVWLNRAEEENLQFLSTPHLFLEGNGCCSSSGWDYSLYFHFSIVRQILPLWISKFSTVMSNFWLFFFFLILSSINNGSSNCFLFNKLHLL